MTDWIVKGRRVAAIDENGHEVLEPFEEVYSGADKSEARTAARDDQAPEDLTEDDLGGDPLIRGVHIESVEEVL